MTRATEELLEEFEALPEQERSELIAELARRVAHAPHDGPSDDDLLAVADRLFVELDQRERLMAPAGAGVIRSAAAETRTSDG